MIPSPILKVLFSLQTNQVRSLLMGGQACVWYGGAEFSRDIDIAVLADAQTLAGLRKAIVDLQAVQIAVPPFEAQYLHRGLGIHFRCQREDVRGLRLDVMERMRGVATFDELWSRRTDAQFENSQTVTILALPDLVAAKKTQRDKDWPMIRRLIEVNYLKNRDEPSPAHLDFWFREARSEFILLELAAKYAAECRIVMTDRPLLGFALTGEHASLTKSLMEEQQAEMEADRVYWKPLRGELEGIRHSKRRE